MTVVRDLGGQCLLTLLTPVVPGLLAAVHIDQFYFWYSNWSSSETMVYSMFFKERIPGV